MDKCPQRFQSTWGPPLLIMFPVYVLTTERPIKANLVKKHVTGDTVFLRVKKCTKAHLCTPL